MNIHWHGQTTDPYAPLIEQFIEREFPQLSSKRPENILDAVITEFIASKQYRLGPRPNPESEVMMRDVARRAIAEGRPIPVLIPAAAVKVPIGECMDVAELSALRILACLQRRISDHYTPGINIRIRMEDLTEYAISADVPNVRTSVEQYVGSFKSLIDVLGYGGFITAIPESSLANPQYFAEATRGATRVFVDYLDAADSGDPSVAEHERILSGLGWRGGVSLAMRGWLKDRYARLYPTVPREQYNQIMAPYLAAILTRRNMGAMGEDKSFQGRLEISFAPALPDAPVNSTRVYYRTVPYSQSSNHMPFWNAKGHLRINNQNEARIALGNWQEQYTPGTLELVGNNQSVTLRADYTLE